MLQPVMWLCPMTMLFFFLGGGKEGGGGLFVCVIVAVSLVAIGGQSCAVALNPKP